MEFKDKNQRLSDGFGTGRIRGSAAKPRVSHISLLDETNEINFYPTEVNYYSVPPFGAITLEEADELVKERMNILKVFDDMKLTTVTAANYATFSDIIEQKLSAVESKFEKNFYKGSQGSAKNKTVSECRRRDHVSHFLLRLYCCQNQDLRGWFIDMESNFLRYRLLNTDIPDFLRVNNLLFERIQESTKNELIQSHKLDFLLPPKCTWEQMIIFRLPFEEALDVVKSRKAYLDNGYAYVTSDDIVCVICNNFRLELANCLASLHLQLPSLEEDQRLIPRVGAIYSEIKLKRSELPNQAEREIVTPEIIDDLCKESFPPCMRNIHETLRKNHHLKHYARLHYGLFLKGIGLSLEDALAFFRDEFIKTVTPERFQREYAYNIRYNYGKEGKKVSLSAYSCTKIINEHPPGPSDNHGCPFRHYDVENLRRTLKSYSLKEENTEEIIVLAQEKNYCGACTKLFNATHPLPLPGDELVYHPNQFYKDSRRIRKGWYKPSNSPSSNDIEFDNSYDIAALTCEIPVENAETEGILTSDSNCDVEKQTEKAIKVEVAEKMESDMVPNLATEEKTRESVESIVENEKHDTSPS